MNSLTIGIVACVVYITYTIIYIYVINYEDKNE